MTGAGGAARAVQEFLDQAHHYSPLIMEAFGVHDGDAYLAAVTEMGAVGATGAAMVTWASVLAAVGTDPAVVLPDHVAILPVDKPDLIYRHARALINTARACSGSPDEATVMISRWRTTSDALEDLQVWWLVRLLVGVTHPVLEQLGGLGQYGSIYELVTGLWQDTLPRKCIAPTAAGLAAISTGNIDTGLDHLMRTPPEERLNALLLVAHAVLRDGQVSAIAVLDEDGTPAGVATVDDLTDPGHRLAAKVAQAIAAQDRDGFAACKPRIAELTVLELDSFITTMAVTIGQYIGQRFAKLT
ncbi:hypothetical protein NQK81_02200 [Amycolatopsis roodepoortensis]|uniref:hypothetical protein n=1 Tax=Amycolatopsis roodepoortensis TaxID=700274 RepID=UPI00214C09FC|nr:hypothetical protein [Amycolatopsis roodepoortensis]UUV32286.1 hypothetical protein NQK81_02200 [Amycolatopsis roodepoortensis]